jgi:hypothetical protein
MHGSMYLHGKAELSDLLNRLLHSFLGLTLAVTVTVFFCKLDVF